MKKSTFTAEYAGLRERLAQIRAKSGLTQRRLASAMRLPHSWVAKVENGERRIDLVEFGWYCDACGVSPAKQAAEFFDGLKRDRNGRSR